MASHRRFFGLASLAAAALSIAACGSPVARTTSLPPGSAATAGSVTTTGSATTASSGIGFVPGLLTQVGTSPKVMILGRADCASGVCLELWSAVVGAGGGVADLTRLTAPPSEKPTVQQPTGSVDSLVFANHLDGYALETDSPDSTDATTLYATTDGGRAWNKVALGTGNSVLEMVATSSEFYAVLVHCSGTNITTTKTCDDYRLARSSAGSTSWSNVAIPGTTALDGGEVGLAAEGTQVWLTYQVQAAGAEPVLLSSQGGKAPFSAKSEPSLVSVNGCGLGAFSGGVLWADCPTGMMATRFRSTDDGDHFTGFWTYSGTAGAGFDPVNGDVAYRYTGIAEKDPSVPANELQRTTNGGASFTSVATLPFNPEAASQLVFVNQADGFALGSIVPSSGNVNDEVPTVLETHDGGASWSKVNF